ncbi:hypothetical protein LCGC14_1726820 [marine sediment metagenome]|uniref:Uncharacterized protein n=1 Tax=marine sediment metagenome TaxID=412755 RepID=A0A0F9HAR9_9ZZZZ
MHSKKKILNLLLITGFILISIPVGLSLYHANKPIFSYNYIEDNFEDQIPFVFPIGWLSVVNPWNVRVVYDGGNKVMEIKSSTTSVTEITRRFKRTSEGVIESKVKMLDVNGRFVIHMTQLDREYDPYDDIIIAFLDGGVYVVGEEHIITKENDPALWEKLIMLNDDTSWAIDEQGLEDSVPLMNYVINVWYSVRIDYDREDFHLSINGNTLGVFNYPKYDSPYFTAVYFVSFMTSSTFRFYVDNVKITIIQSVDYIHPGNVALLVIIPISTIGIYFLYKRKKR